MTRDAALIWCPFASVEDARNIAETLLAERLVACANVVPALHSTFLWKGTIDRAEEAGVLFKTLPDRLEAAMDRIAQLHPYEEPALSGWCVRASAGTVRWLEEELAGQRSSSETPGPGSAT